VQVPVSQPDSDDCEQKKRLFHKIL
jgi:hypothetical protein